MGLFSRRRLPRLPLAKKTPAHLPDEFTLVLQLLPLLVGVGVLVPLDAVHHQLLVLLLLLGTAFDDDDVDVVEKNDAAGHEQLLRVRLDLELLGRVRQVL